MIGEVLEGRYRIVGTVGAGGVGAVYRAEHLQLGHHVALKVLLPHLATHPQFRPRFEREARALAALAHPHVVSWTEYSYWNGTPYLVMELLSGRSLREVIAEGPTDPHRVRRIARQILGTLIHAHRLGFIHRDLKPDNIFLLDLPAEPDFVKVLDFGFVKLIERDDADPERSQLTASGMGLGTPTYMSPEQAWGDKTGPGSDLYSLGIILFELLTGRRPYVGEIARIVKAHMTEPLPEIADGARVASPELDAFVRRATEKRAEDRFASADEMLAALDALPDASAWMVLPGHRPRPSVGLAPGRDAGPRRRMPRIAIAVCAIAALGIAAGVAVDRIQTSADVVRPQGVPQAARVAPPDPPPREPDPAPVDEGSDPAEVAASEAAEGAGNAGLGPSPFDTRPRLPSIWNAHRRIASGQTLSPSTERAMERLADASTDDPRPLLLLAANAARNRSDGRAIALFLSANRTAADARSDPRMLRTLVRFAGESRFQRAAADALESIYGSVALPAIDDELARPDLTPTAYSRLSRLRERLASRSAP